MSKKKIFLLLSVLSLSAVLFSSCKKEETVSDVRMVGFYITPASSVVEVGESKQITVWASYTDGAKVNITDSLGVEIKSSDEAVAKVEKGVASGLTDGKVVLTATYQDKMDTCSFTVSSIDHITLSIDSKQDILRVVPEEKFSEDKITVMAYFKSKDSTKVTLDTLYSKNEECAKVVYKDGKLQSLDINRVQDSFSEVVAVYKTKDETTVKDSLKVYVGKLDSVSLSMDATLRDSQGKVKYKSDTLLLGASSTIITQGFFSWFNGKVKDTVDILSLVKDTLKSSNTAILGLDVTNFVVTANDTTITSKDVTYSAQFFGNTYSSRPIYIVKDTTYKNPKYKVEVYNEYAYVGDIVTYKYTEYFDNEVSIDLTNTGNKDISSALAQGTEDPATFVVSSGVLSVPATCTEKGENDSLKVYVKYKKNGQELTTNSKGIVLYDNPSLAIDADGNIKINGSAVSLHFNECTIVDNTGKDWTGKINKSTLVLEVLEEMNGRTLVMTYGPEKRTASVYIKAQ